MYHPQHPGPHNISWRQCQQLSGSAVAARDPRTSQPLLNRLRDSALLGARAGSQQEAAALGAPARSPRTSALQIHTGALSARVTS